MLSIPATNAIFLYVPPTDMRKSFHGLSALVYAHLGRPSDGRYYVFVNRRRTHLKILYWDGDGLALWYKRLESGQFIIPANSGNRVALDRRSLSLLLEGIVAAQKTRRFSFKESSKM